MKNKLNIGIITIHRSYNYGSILQTFAIQYVLESMGHKVEVIDYTFPNEFQWLSHNQKENYKENRLTKNNFKPLVIKSLFSYFIYMQHQLFDSFRKKI